MSKIVTTVRLQSLTAIFQHDTYYGAIERSLLDLQGVYGDPRKHSLIRYGIIAATSTQNFYVDQDTKHGPFMGRFLKFGATCFNSTQEKNSLLEVGYLSFKRGPQTHCVQQLLSNLDGMVTDDNTVLQVLKSGKVFQNWTYGNLTPDEQRLNLQERLISEVVTDDKNVHCQEAPLTLLPMILILGALHDTKQTGRNMIDTVLQKLTKGTNEYDENGKESKLDEKILALIDPLNAAERLRILSERPLLVGKQAVHVSHPDVIKCKYKANDAGAAHVRFQKMLEQKSRTLALELCHQQSNDVSTT